MTLFTCKICNYNTKINSNYHKHLRTKKHLHNVENNSIKIEPQHCPKIDPKNGKKSIQKNFICDVCNKGFTTKAHLNRHINNNCLGKNNQDHLLDIIQKQNKTIEDMYNQHQEEKKIIFEKMDLLFEHIGNTTNITNNKIILNCYGSEDYSHISDNYKNKLLQIPYAMIPKFIEELHFKNPENNNIFLPNKNKPHLKIYSDNKWIYRDKNEAIKDLIDKNFNYLDSYYNQIGYESLSESQKKRYDEFHDKLKNDDSGTPNKVAKDTELLLLNNDINHKN